MLKRRISRTVSLVVAALASTASFAHAQSTAPGFDVGRAFTLRIQPPMTQVVTWQQNGSRQGGFAMLGGSLSRRFYDLLEVEAGGTLIFNACGEGTDAVARLGISPSLVTPRSAGSVWNVRVPLLASGHLSSLSGDSCDGHTETSGRVLDLAGGIDATRWSAKGTGFNMRLLLGFVPDGFSEATLAVGVAF